MNNTWTLALGLVPGLIAGLAIGKFLWDTRANNPANMSQVARYGALGIAILLAVVGVVIALASMLSAGPDELGGYVTNLVLNGITLLIAGALFVIPAHWYPESASEDDEDDTAHPFDEWETEEPIYEDPNPDLLEKDESLVIVDDLESNTGDLPDWLTEGTVPDDDEEQPVADTIEVLVDESDFNDDSSSDSTDE